MDAQASASMPDNTQPLCSFSLPHEALTIFIANIISQERFTSQVKNGQHLSATNNFLWLEMWIKVWKEK